MTTRQQELESLGTEFEKREAGFAELTEFYEKVEAIYAQASAFMSEGRGSFISDSTKTVRADADLGRILNELDRTGTPAGTPDFDGVRRGNLRQLNKLPGRALVDSYMPSFLSTTCQFAPLRTYLALLADPTGRARPCFCYRSKPTPPPAF